MGVGADIAVSTTMMLCGNYCTRGGNHFPSGEVPSGDAFYPNSVPTSNTLPASLYYGARPSFFTVSGVGTVTWPPIDPDVTSGTSAAGHVYTLPAQLVFEAAGGSIANFNPNPYGR